MKRYLEKYITEDVKEKMVFIGGPRQVGKTTLAKNIAQKFKFSAYLNWDNRDHRMNIIKEKFPSETKFLMLDEINKYEQWKNYLKGLYDTQKDKFSILATGSARLNVYRKGGDSLMGRYFYYRLHPFSLAELMEIDNAFTVNQELNFHNKSNKAKILDKLLTFGGFPDPFLKEDERFLRRWHNSKINQLVKEDIRDLENLKHLSLFQLLVEIIPEKVASLLSINSLREDLDVNHKTMVRWFNILENFYYCFRIFPYAENKKIRSLKKEPKLYLWDYSEIKNNEGAKFENLIAGHLLKFIHFLYDVHGYKAELNFLRDIDGREVDFLITIDKKPWFAVETKLKNKDIPKSLLYFGDRLKIPFLFQVVRESGVDFSRKEVRTISADKFLTALV